MKVIFFIFTLLLSISLFGKDSESKIEIKTEKAKCSVDNYELCLKHENVGVVQSALVNVVKFRYRCPIADFTSIIKQLKVLSKKAENEKISQKAELVLQILQNPELVAEIGSKYYDDLDQFLDAILLSSRFEQELTLNLIR